VEGSRGRYSSLVVASLAELQAREEARFVATSARAPLTADSGTTTIADDTQLSVIKPR
jgi:hypothetical protein